MKLRALVLVATFAAACGDGERAPAPPAMGVADASFEGVNERGERATIWLHDYAGTDGTLVVRVQGGAWCGTCNWHASHTRELLAKDPSARVLDLVVGNPENDPATSDDAVAWRASLDATDHVAVGADPNVAFRALVKDNALPVVITIARKTMTVVRVESNPPAEGPLVDGLFHRNEWDMIRAIDVPAPQGADVKLAAFGKELFEDKELSPAHVACATCHDPKRAFADDVPRAVGAATGNRHTPRIALAASSPKQFWDGRASSLEEQALGPITNPAEMASSAAFVASRVRARFGANGSSDDAILHDVAVAISAYERTLRVEPSALDRYVRGDRSALTFAEKQGLAMFAREGCMQCHWGSRLTDDAFHVTRVPSTTSDHGRGEGAFKTPSLRGVAGAHFFGHAGTIDSLDAMIALYGDGDANDPRATGTREPWIPRFGETTRWSIARFLSTLR